MIRRLAPLAIAAAVVAVTATMGRAAGPSSHPLGAEQLAVYDCRAEVNLLGVYWDRLSNRLRLDPGVYRRAVQAYQSGDIQACYSAVEQARRYLGL